MSAVAPTPSTVAERIARLQRECSGVWASFGVTSWERERLREWAGYSTLSARQLEILAQIEEKVFGER